MTGSGNVACAARAGSDPIECFVHRCEHRRMLAHAEVIVGTPDGHLVLQAVIEGLWKMAWAPFEIGKDPISIFASYDLETRLKELIELHRFPRRSALP